MMLYYSNNTDILFGTVSFCKYSVLFSSYFLLSVILFVCQKEATICRKKIP